MCGNGGRCAARFAHLKGIAGSRLSFEHACRHDKSGGAARRQSEAAAYKAKGPETRLPHRPRYKELFVSSVDTGVPHAVLLTDVELTPVEELGRAIRYHRAFSPKGTNVDFVQVVDTKNVRIRTYERGVEGETYACGTGCVAAGVILHEKGLVESKVNLLTKGGEGLRVYVGDEVYLEGSVRIIYEGTLWPEAVE